MKHRDGCFGHMVINEVTHSLCGVSVAQINRAVDAFVRSPYFKALKQHEPLSN